MRGIQHTFMRIILIPLWIVLGILYAVGNIVVGLGNAVFYVLSGLCFFTAVVCISLMGEPIIDQKLILIGGCVFSIIPVISVWILSLVVMAKIIISDVIFG